MATKDRTIKIKASIAASTQDIYDAFTHASALCEWLCNVAEADAHEGGRVYLWWNNGYYASGEFTSLRPAERIVFSWHGRNEPGITSVKISLTPGDEGVTLLNLAQSGIGPGKEWRQTAREFKLGWKRSLENLRSVLETGIDLRFARRPMIGFSGGEELDAAKAESLDLGISEGILITGVMDGMGAQAAGLQKDDILVRLGGKKISNFSGLIKILQGHQASDTLKAVFYRGKEKLKCKIQLTPRPLPAIPESAEALAEVVQTAYNQQNEQLKGCLKGVSEETASKPITAGEWSIKENLAHLVAEQRDIQAWITSLIEGQEITQIYHTNLNSRLTAMLSAYTTLKSLLDELFRSQTETLAYLRILPLELVARKGSFWRLGYHVIEINDHNREHIAQICASVTEKPAN